MSVGALLIIKYLSYPILSYPFAGNPVVASQNVGYLLRLHVREEKTMNSPLFSGAVLERWKCPNAPENGTFLTDCKGGAYRSCLVWERLIHCKAKRLIVCSVCTEKTWPGKGVCHQTELPWVSQHFLTKLGEPFECETKRLARLSGSPT